MTTGGTRPRLALVIPAYNEAGAIGDVLAGLPRAHADVDIVTVVVNDHSSDDTGGIARSAGAVVIEHLYNAGSGAATATGLAYARRAAFDYAVTVDADGQHTAEDATKVIDAIVAGAGDLVIGSRLRSTEGMPRSRVFGNRMLTGITALLFGVRLTDSQSGLKGFSRSALESIELASTGYEFCSEIVWRAKQSGLRVTEIPIRAVYTDYSLAKGQRNVDGFAIVRNLIKRKVLDLDA
jgi:glycosyltransferase involved in cell wall biosynthesis